jgi:hypothetical protein
VMSSLPFEWPVCSCMPCLRGFPVVRPVWWILTCIVPLYTWLRAHLGGWQCFCTKPNNLMLIIIYLEYTAHCMCTIASFAL